MIACKSVNNFYPFHVNINKLFFLNTYIRRIYTQRTITEYRIKLAKAKYPFRHNYIMYSFISCINNTILNYPQCFLWKAFNVCVKLLNEFATPQMLRNLALLSLHKSSGVREGTAVYDGSSQNLTLFFIPNYSVESHSVQSRAIIAD